ncbi:MAG: response regulator, partial [Burkholderiaceae bacterium]|nr:response regulator [Burkholderiaceae bacterium]
MFLKAILGRLMLTQKFFILSLVALVLACLPAYLYINEADKTLDEEIAEIKGIRPLTELRRLLQMMQQHRGLVVLAANDASVVRGALPAKEREIDVAMDALAAEIKDIPDKTVQAHWNAIRHDWSNLRGQTATGGTQVSESIQAHVDLIATLIEENELVGDYYGLSLDPDRDSYQLIQFMYYQLPYLTEETGQMRAKGTALLAQKTKSVEDRVLISAVAGRVRNRFDQVVKAYDKAAGANPSFAEALSKDVRDMSDLTTGAIQAANDSIVKEGAASLSAADYFARFTQAMDGQFRVGDDADAVLERLLEDKAAVLQRTRKLMLGAMAALIALAGLIQFAIARSISGPATRALSVARALTGGATEKIEAIDAIANGNLEHEVKVGEVLQIDPNTLTHDEMGGLLRSIVQMSEVQRSLDFAFDAMTRSLRASRDADHARDWLKTGLNELNAVMRGEHETREMAAKVLTYLAERVQAGVGALYLFEGDRQELSLVAGYALSGSLRSADRFRLGQGLVGQAAAEKKTLTLTDVPDGYLPIGSGLGQASPKTIVALPMLYAENLIGVMELGSFRGFSESEMDFLAHVKEGLAIGFGVNQSRQRMQVLLAQTEEQTEELRVQQEELQASNEELEERAEMLETQREQIRVKNAEIETASREIQRKVDELEKVSAYKSEFLANMSHELRTPLNSMLILSSLLQKNKDGQLSPKQVEYAATIHSAGKDLLNLINDILDLSKIEAGRLEFHAEDIPVAGLVEEIGRLFHPIAEHQHVEFRINVAPDAPATLHADPQRTQQIIKNLLGNAFKFTAKGHVSLTIESPLDNPLQVPALAIAVGDSGIGIAPEKHEQIFHAFQQADGSTSRKYGGTGLGLSISRQLAQRMGGDIRLNSVLGHGSTFTLYLPLDTAHAPARAGLAVAAPPPAAAPHLPAAAAVPAVPSAPSPATRFQASAPTQALSAATPVAVSQDAELPASEVEDDRAGLGEGERSILIVEDDFAFAAILRDTVREHGFKAIVATDGESGLMLAAHFLPSAVLLDVMLPHIDGWGVMRSIKDNPRTRHIPVHFMTCLEDRQKALNMGAIGFISKPVSSDQLEQVFKVIGEAIDKSAKRLLVIEDNEIEAKSIAALLETGGLEIVIVRSGKEALERLRDEKFDCMVLDLGLVDMTGFELLDEIQRQDVGRGTPVIVHSGRSLSDADERRLQEYTANIIVKGAQSPERLLNEVSLFLHLVESSLPQEKQKMIRHALDKEAMLEKRKVLLVDDDMRNIFSLSSVLGEKGMHIVEATNGKEALIELEAHPDVD